MTFISLRKPQPAPDATQTDSLEDDALEAAGPEGQDEAEDGKPVGFISALQQGVTGWFIWCANLITPRWTYTVHLVALWAACYYGALVFWGVVLGLAVAIVTFMPRDPVDRLTTRLEHVGTPRPDTPAESSPATPEQPAADPLVALMWKLIAGASGVHLKTLTQVLAAAAEKGGKEAPSKALVEAALATRGIPLRDSVRDISRKINKGVHREDLTAWEQTLSQTADPTPRPDP
ncbi:hypothetical protein [Streptomyces canus]|uniref:hypothetical protein n=1 Tax=Streptomyces canus TaxID=58343 RepID=UPI0038644B4F|nr:hypothetical protein OH824_17825 [Streptomyces canus]